MQDRGHLLTEQRNEHSRAFDCQSIADGFDIMNAEDAKIAAAVARAKPQIVDAVEKVVEAFTKGGRLIYVGSGTSGRLGIIDAAECPPTFLVDPEMVQGIIAGGPDAIFRSKEHAEDDENAGAEAVEEKHVGLDDVIFGIAAGGTTPYVHGAINRAAQLGATTIFLACVPADQYPDQADVSIRVLTGPEVVTGSTRLKAGLATKMVLNMITTLAMVQMGKVFENLMVDVNTRSCSKLVDRAIRIIVSITGQDRKQAEELLSRAHGKVKTAVVMHLKGVDRQEAEQLLDHHGGHIRRILEAS
jgi:N-acetylmuramic acid 6-phosphate etherase